MAYVAPSGRVEYFGDIGLSPNYDNALYFASTADKDQAFDGLARLGYEDNVSYVYKDRSAFRSALPISTLINCGYIRFRNPMFENKWFYAFVTSVDYINNGCTEISFELDELMSWMGSFSLGQCLVVREHTTTDNYYEHLIEEDLPTGDYTLCGESKLQPDNWGPVLILSVARVSNTVGAVGQYKGNILSGAVYEKYDISPTGLTDLQTRIDGLITDQKEDAMISAQIVFGAMAPEATETAADPLPIIKNWVGQYRGYEYAGAFGGYVPKNKKLYNYPYRLMSVSNGEGTEIEFRYEFFSDHRPHFYMFGIAADNPELAIIPTQYKGSGVEYVPDEMLVMRQWPQASIAVDQYKAWVAQMTSGGGWVSVVGSIASAVGGAALSALTGNPLSLASTGMSLVDKASSLLADRMHYKAMPDAVQGTANSNILMGINNKDFRIYHRTITADYAREIDDYFSAYGYRVNVVKTPSLDNRPYWTFVQTSGAIVRGSLPASAARNIENILNRGCRFWKSIAKLGNMSLDNSPA